IPPALRLSTARAPASRCQNKDDGGEPRRHSKEPRRPYPLHGYTSEKMAACCQRDGRGPERVLDFGAARFLAFDPPVRVSSKLRRMRTATAKGPKADPSRAHLSGSRPLLVANLSQINMQATATASQTRVMTSSMRRL